METKEINETLYGVEKLPATKGLKLQLKLGKFLGNGLNDLRGIEGGNTESILQSIGSLITKIDDAEFADFVKATVLHARKMIQTEGNEEPTPIAINFDTEFQDDYVAMWEVFMFVLEVNLGKFLQGIKSRFANSTKKTQTKRKRSTLT